MYGGTPAADDDAPKGPEVLLTPTSLQATVGPLPQYPLYYHLIRDGSLFIVCTELEPIARLLPSLRIDARRLVSHISMQPNPDAASTAFAAVRRVVAGERLAFDAGGLRVDARLPRAGAAYSTAKPLDLAMELRARLLAATARAMANARRVVVFAGGGLDSSAILAMALSNRDATSAHVEVIAQRWAAPGDDGPYLEALERDLGITAVRVRASDAGPWFARSMYTDAQPARFGATCLDMQLWTTAVQRGADVSLTGHAGDRVFGNLSISFAPLAARGRPLSALSRALKLRTPSRVSRSGRIGSWIVWPLLRPHLPAPVLGAMLRRKHRKRWMTPRFMALLDECLSVLPRRLPECPDEWLEHHCTSTSFAELAGEWGQLASATQHVAIDVTRDLDLVRFVSTVDPLVLSEGDMARGLLRMALKGLVPDTVRLRPDKALGQPAFAAAALGAHALEMLADLGTLRALASTGLVDPVAFEEPFRAWFQLMRRGERSSADPADEWWGLSWQLLSVEAFLRQYAKGRELA
jgi:asparagine synthase (glutamine-hydrolysing)